MRLPEFPAFAFGCGEEASDPLVLHDGGVVRVDELAASGHLDRMDADLADVASLGVDVWRYGMPWRLTERSPGDYDWGLWDRALAACDRHGLAPVVDLCHFGLPDHYAGFCDPAWVEGFVRYVDAFLARYREPVWFTPVNEPYISALMSAMFGSWNDRRSSPADFGVALSHAILANLEAMARIRADRDGWFVGAEAFTIPVGMGDDDAHAAEVARMRAYASLGWDLQFGVEPMGEAAAAVDAIDGGVRSRIAALATTDHTIAGHDFYPTSIVPVGGSLESFSIEMRVAVYGAAAAAWHRRYGVDFWVAETSNLSLPVDRQEDWLAALHSTLVGLRADGLPVRGICWYSRGDQYDWDTALTRPVGRITEVGLFDAGRRPRPVAEAFRRLAMSQPS